VGSVVGSVESVSKVELVVSEFLVKVVNVLKVVGKGVVGSVELMLVGIVRELLDDVLLVPNSPPSGSLEVGTLVGGRLDEVKILVRTVD